MRGWLRALVRRAEWVRAVFTGLDPLGGLVPPVGCLVGDAVQVVGAAAAAARRRLPVVGAVSAWEVASAVTGGRLLAPVGPAGLVNTSWLWAAG